MDFIKQYFKIIGYMLMGIVFMFSSFYLLANAYHFVELRKDYVVNVSEQASVKMTSDNLKQVESNIATFDPNTYHGNLSVTTMNLIKEHLSKCVTDFNNEVYTSKYVKNKISIIDVYELRESYDNYILNDCLVNNLNWAIGENESYRDAYLNQSKEINKLYSDSLLTYTSYLKKDLINNSSYYFNTSISSSSVKDNTRDGFNEVIDAYNKASRYLLYLSNWFRMEVGV